MKVSTKLYGAFGVLAVVLAGLLIYHVRTIHHVVSTNYELSEISSRLYLSTTRQIGWLNQLEENASKFWVTSHPGYLERFEEAYEGFDEGVRELAESSMSPDERAEVARLEEIWRGFGPVAARVSDPGAAAGPPALELREQLASLRFQTRRLSDASQAAMRERLDASATAARRAERISWAAASGTLLLSLLVFVLIIRSITRALNRLQHGTQQVAGGNFAHRLPADREDEFSALARDFNTMTRRLGELDRMKRDFLSKVSHDLKTPLASMRETVQVMLDGVPGRVTEKQRRLLELTDQSAQRLSGMIAKILDLSAMEAGALKLDVGAHDLREVVEVSVDAVALGDPGRRTRVGIELPTGLGLECDRDRMIQVLVNLLENALKFSPAGSPVRLSARLAGRGDPAVPAELWRGLEPAARQAGAVLVEVSDRGRGVPDEDKARVFEHFFQSANGDRSSSRGVGLGLAICREIVGLHGGAIWVRDTPGGGSTFAMLLPRPLQVVPQLRPSRAAVAPTHSVRG